VLRLAKNPHPKKVNVSHFWPLELLDFLRLVFRSHHSGIRLVQRGGAPDFKLRMLVLHRSFHIVPYFLFTCP